LRALAASRGLRIIDELPQETESPLVDALRKDAQEPMRLRVAARAEAAWGPPEPDAETFRRRLARDEAAYPTPRPAPSPPSHPDLLADDEEDGT
ncbi:MAG: hypothetical protein ACOC8D_02720, partial [bacterium]